jgi:hypothetical protein
MNAIEYHQASLLLLLLLSLSLSLSPNLTSVSSAILYKVTVVAISFSFITFKASNDVLRDAGVVVPAALVGVDMRASPPLPLAKEILIWTTRASRVARRGGVCTTGVVGSLGGAALLSAPTRELASETGKM